MKSMNYIWSNREFFIFQSRSFKFCGLFSCMKFDENAKFHLNIPTVMHVKNTIMTLELSTAIAGQSATYLTFLAPNDYLI